MEHRNDNMLLYIAMADAYAVACEYLDPGDLRSEEQTAACLQLDKYHEPLGSYFRGVPPGTYTDDTQMSIAVASALAQLSAWDLGTKNLTPIFLGEFYKAFKADPRKGYSRVTQKALEAAANPIDLADRLETDSKGNGACMRAVPLGVIENVSDLLNTAEEQARITHNTFGGVVSSQAVALMSHFALHTDYPLQDIGVWCKLHMPIFEMFEETWDGPVRPSPACEFGDMGTGLKTAWAAYTLIRSMPSLRSIMHQTIHWGGDTDSLAAVAWGIASARYQDEVLPAFFERDLEKARGGTYGPYFLKMLGRQLMDRYFLGNAR